jgi:hypothetical protein
VIAGAGAYALWAGAQTHAHGTAASTGSPGDPRQLVSFPEPMRMHTLENMRDHLLALQEITFALAKSDYDGAARIAEQRLGVSSLERRGAAHVARYMPREMQAIGTQMHRSASRFALDAQGAGASNDIRPALAGLGTVMQQCVACHAAYRLH